MLYWGDSVSPEEHGDGFTDTLIDYAGVGVVTLDYSAGRNFPNANGPPVTYASLTVTQKTSAQSWFRDHYAKEYYGASSYNALTAAQQLRIPPYDTVAPLPVATDRERLAIHVYGVGFDSLTAVEQNAITSAIAAPSASFYIQDARKSVWYCKVDDDLIAHHNFGKFHDQLTAGEQEQIRLLNANVASYRTGKSSPYSVFSEQQLDRMCDIISQSTVGQFDASGGVPAAADFRSMTATGPAWWAVVRRSPSSSSPAAPPCSSGRPTPLAGAWKAR